MYFIYTFLLASWIILMLPYFAYNAFKNKKYLPKLRERTGDLPVTLHHDGRPTIWFHSCSVGETLSIQPLAHMIHQLFPNYRLVFSVITRTGRKIAEERFAKYGEGNVFYFPIDMPNFANRVLDIVKPEMMISVDTEIWPNVLHECKKRGVKLVLVNGRISAESFRSYRWAQPALGIVFKNYDLLMMKSEEDANRIRRMGAPLSKIKISGNIKYDRDIVEKQVTDAQLRAISDSFGLQNQIGNLIVAGSTHEREEETLFLVLDKIRQTPGLENTRLLIAPRHPERFSSVVQLAQKMGHTITKRSDNQPNPEADILVLDTLGELATAYKLATIAFVGGTLIPHGGQSIMEPALHARPIVIGPSMENFPKIIDEFQEIGAVKQISAAIDQLELQREQLYDAFKTLLLNPSERDHMGEQALSLFEKSRGATAFTANEIATILNKSI